MGVIVKKTPKKTLSPIVNQRAAVLGMSKKAETSKTKSTLIKKPTPKTPNKKLPFTKAASNRIETKAVTEEINIPATASLRLIEKVELYQKWYKEVWPQQIAQVAKGAGFIFVFLGAGFASFSYLVDKDFGLNTAALICSTSLCAEVAEVELPEGAPDVTFLNSLPENLLADIDFSISAENVTDLKTYLLSADSGTQVILKPFETTETGRYNFIITQKDLSGPYTLIAEATNNEGTKYIFKGPTFKVTNLNLDKAVEKQPKEIIKVDTATTSASTTITDLPVEVATTTELSIEQNDSTADVVESNVSDIPKADIFSVNYQTSGEAEFLKITTGNFLPSSLQVYAVVPDSKSALYLGEATMVQSEWYLSLSALELPTNPLYLYAAFTTEGDEYRSVGVTYQPKTISTTDLLKAEDLSILLKKIDLALSELGIENSKRLTYFSTYNQITNQSFEAELLDSVMVETVAKSLLDYSSNLDFLVFIYAAALQTDTEYFVKLAKANLTNYYLSLIADTVGEETNNNYELPALETIFLTRLDKVLLEVARTEAEARSVTSGLINRDTDKDSISDYDELVNFGTNPSLSDTDQDGVIDSVEIAASFNPLMPDIEQHPTYKNYANSILAAEDTVDIQAIEHQVIKDSKLAKQANYLISGTSVPNSFVFVSVKNSGKTGVVKSSSQGNFTYTLENESSLDPITITAGLANNSGEIAVRTKEFTYTPKSNRLTASVSDGLQQEISDSREKLVRSSVIIGAVGLVALGFVLLLLAQIINSRRGVLLVVKKIK